MGTSLNLWSAHDPDILPLVNVVTEAMPAGPHFGVTWRNDPSRLIMPQSTFGGRGKRPRGCGSSRSMRLPRLFTFTTMTFRSWSVPRGAQAQGTLNREISVSIWKKYGTGLSPPRDLYPVELTPLAAAPHCLFPGVSSQARQSPRWRNNGANPVKLRSYRNRSPHFAASCHGLIPRPSRR